MAEYIERVVAIEIINSYEKTVTQEGLVVVEAIKDIVATICPAANVVPVREAKNITQDNPVDEFICSECGVKLSDISAWRYDETLEDEILYEYECKFCPECGARIKEGE